MKKFNLKLTILLILCYLLPLLLHAQAQKKLVEENGRNSTSYAPWLSRIKNPRFFGCWRRPWICNLDSPRMRRRCCWNRCVDVSSDANNCGLCGIRCRFTRQCCGGICVDTNVNPFHCGRCNHRCRSPSFCFYGMCGYAQPSPPFPFPFPPRPFPPRPHPPKHSPAMPSPPKGGGRKHDTPVLAVAAS